MENPGETSSSAQVIAERGAGGKLRKPPARKLPATPYARPQKNETQRRRWLSKLLDPASRLISGGANLIFPTFFSKSLVSSSANALPAPDSEEDHDKLHTESMQNPSGDNHNCAPDHGVSRSTGVSDPSRTADRSKSSSDFDWGKHDKRADLTHDDGLSEIERLMQGKRFSRDEINRLIEIIHSRAADLPDVKQESKILSMTPRGDAEGPIVPFENPRKLIEDKQEDLHKAVWGTSTPLVQSTMQDKVGASPVEIARAFMGARKSELSLGSRSIILKDERASLHGDEFASKQFIAAPSPKPSPHWPGAIVQDQRGYLTPESQRGRFGLHNFPRTPYSRTIHSKSKLTQLQGDSNRCLNFSSTPLQKLQTPIYGQSKSRSKALDDGHGSVGPIRRVRHKVPAETPSRGSAYFHSSLNSPFQAETSNVFEGFFSDVKKNLEPGGTSSSSIFQSLDSKRRSSEVGVPAVHPHSSQMARTILEHLDRNPPTPKDKFAELKLATSWKNPPSSDVTTIMPNEQNGLLHLGDQFDKKKSAQWNENRGNSIFKVPPQEGTNEGQDAVKKTTSASDIKVDGPVAIHGGNAWLSKDFSKSKDSQIKSTHEDDPKIVPNADTEVLNLQRPPPHSMGIKPVLPSISIGKPYQKWKFSSDNSSGFTFPVSASPGVFSEPPTPSIIPSFSASDQQKEESVVPSYSFGLKKSSPTLVFSFPSTSSSLIHDDVSDPKFNFGSDKTTRISFSSIGKNAICY